MLVLHVSTRRILESAQIVQSKKKSDIKRDNSGNKQWRKNVKYEGGGRFRK